MASNDTNANLAATVLSNQAVPAVTSIPPPATISAVVDDMTIKVVEERLVVGKRLVESGRARVHIQVSERDETVEALLMRQDVSVERVTIGQVVTATPPVRTEGDTVIVPVMEEIVVTEVRLVLKEELHIRIDQTRHAEKQVVRLRSEHAEIDQGSPALDVNPSKGTTP